MSCIPSAGAQISLAVKLSKTDFDTSPPIPSGILLRAPHFPRDLQAFWLHKSKGAVKELVERANPNTAQIHVFPRVLLLALRSFPSSDRAVEAKRKTGDG